MVETKQDREAYLMKNKSLVPNTLTAFGLSCGLFIIHKMNMTQVGNVTLQLLKATVGILILAAIADLLDGAVARLMKAETPFGGLFDSLADAITFGVAPTIITLKTLALEPGSQAALFLTCAAMVYTVCGVLRLIRFTLKRSEDDPILSAASKKNFVGLPIPAAAGALASLSLFLFYLNVSQLAQASILFPVMMMLGYLMISRWRFPSLKALRVQVNTFKVVIATVIGALFVFVGIFQYFPLAFFLVSWGYLFIAIALSIIRITAGKRAKTLEDFEPAHDDE